MKKELLIFSIVLLLTSFVYAEVNLMPPEQPTNVLWIHHSIGGQWNWKKSANVYWDDGLGNDCTPFPTVPATYYHCRHDSNSANSGNGELALYYNNYIIHHAEYWSDIGMATNFKNWYYKFSRYIDNTKPEYVPIGNDTDMVHGYSQDINYSEMQTDPFTGQDITNDINEIIMFKPGHLNHQVFASDGTPDISDPVSVTSFLASIENNPSPDIGDVGDFGGRINEIQAIYIGLLPIFANNPDLMFVIWTPTAHVASTYTEQRTLYEWMQNELLQNYYLNGSVYSSYPLDNVMVFNAWNIITGPRVESNYALNKHNNARYNPFIGGIDFITSGDPDYVDSIEQVCPGDGHPPSFCNALLSKAIVNQLNIQYNKWKNISYTGVTGYPQNGLVGYFVLDETDDRSKTGVSLQQVDSVYSHVFDGTANAVLDLGPVSVGGGPFSYSYWYRPNVNSVSVGDHTTVLRKDGVFESTHFLKAGAIGDTSYINTNFGGSFFESAYQEWNNIVDRDTWTHVAFVWNGTCFKHYVDATQILETECESRTVGTSSNNLILGGGTGNLNGAIREVAVYDRALNLGEIKAIFNANAVNASANITINSSFDSASIDYYNVEGNEVNFTVWNDTSPFDTTRPYWLNFKVNNVLGKTVTFNILNASYVYYLWSTPANSEIVYSCDGTNWNRIAGSYSNNVYSFTRAFSCNQVQIAMVFPFSYQDMQNYLTSIEGNQSVNRSNLGLSTQGRNLDIIEVTNFAIPAANKKHIFITSRQHPSEVTATHMLKGLIDFLISSDPDASTMRDNFMFHIVPMVNPDGVYNGRTRFDIDGRNMNREWAGTNSDEVNIVRSKLDSVNLTHEIDLYIDWHTDMNSNTYDNYGYIPEDPASFQIVEGFFNNLSVYTTYDDRRYIDPQGSSRVAVNYAYYEGIPGATLESNQHLPTLTISSLEQEGVGVAYAIRDTFYSNLSYDPDVNFDGNINIIDLAIVVYNKGHVLPDANYNHLDINQDGQINWLDVLEVILRI